MPGRRVASLDPARGVAVLDDGSELPTICSSACQSTARRRSSGRAAWSRTATYRWIRERSRRASPASTRSATSLSGVPKAGVFAEGAARGVATIASCAARARAQRPRNRAGSCYIEFGGGSVGRVDVDFLSGPKPTGTYQRRLRKLRAEKEQFGSSRRRPLVRSLIGSGERTLADQMPTDRLIALSGRRRRAAARARRTAVSRRAPGRYRAGRPGSGPLPTLR